MEVEACDKGGNFIGWLYVEGKNLSVELVAVRLALCVHCIPRADARPAVKGCNKKMVATSNSYPCHHFPFP